MKTKNDNRPLNDEFEPLALGSISEETKGDPTVELNEGLFLESKIPD